jgi:hypothetical protein
VPQVSQYVDEGFVPFAIGVHRFNAWILDCPVRRQGLQTRLGPISVSLQLVQIVWYFRHG